MFSSHNKKAISLKKWMHGINDSGIKKGNFMTRHQTDWM